MAPEAKVNVLLVDDQASNLLSLEAILAGEGLDLVRAVSGEQALMQVLDKDYAAILMDVQMPGMDGFETAELIRDRDRSRHTPILFLTAFQSTEAQIHRGYALGAVDFLSKPVVPAVLRSKVAVFVELFLKTEQVKRQAAHLVENQRREHARALAEEKRRWEVERLREEAAREKKIATEMARRAEELTRSVEERVRAQEQLAAVRDELASQLEDMKRLHALSERLSNSLELATVLQEVLTAVTGLQGTDRGVLMLNDRERDVMTTAASVGFTPEQLDGMKQPAPVGKVTAVISGGIIVEDVEADPVFAPHLAASLGAGYHGICSTPLLTCGGELVGSIATYFLEPHHPSERETHLVELYARQAAEFIDNARLYREIREADRHKGEFLAMLGHELRNPLAPILNALHLMRLPGAGREDIEQAREIAERQVRNLARLVDDLLDVSRIDSGKVELRKGIVDLRTSIARAVETARPLLDARDHTLTVSLPDDPLPLLADAARLEQVLANLLNNAAKYTEPGGRVTLHADRQGDDLVVRVRDNGIGIDPELLPYVFELFTQADRSLDRSQGGLGIGLTLVRRLVDLHGGQVSVTSDGGGRGSEFVVRLPAASPGAEAPEWDPATCGHPLQPGPIRPNRVLLVDDNIDGARVLARLLRADGHRVDVAHDGSKALEIARSAPPDVVLLDIGLPGMDGYEVARRLREAGPSSRAMIVALTGYGQQSDRDRSREAGFDHHLVKPVDPDLVRELIAEHRHLERGVSRATR
jgi:signal transduction histidine kinase/DNA-binding response OmpR family regulator